MAYAQQRAAAQRQIAAKGADVVFTRMGDVGERDPVTQESVTTTAPTAYTRKAIGFPPGRSWQHRNNTLITEAMIELTFVPNGYVPLHTDNVRWAGRDWSIRTWTELDPDGSGAILMQMLIEK